MGTEQSSGGKHRGPAEKLRLVGKKFNDLTEELMPKTRVLTVRF